MKKRNVPECKAKGSRFTFGGLGVDTCSRDPASGVRNRLQPSAHSRCGRKVAVPMGKVRKSVSFSTCQKMWSCRFARQAWHFVTFDVCEEESVRAAVVAEKLCAFGKSMEKSQKRVFLEVSEDVLMSSCVAGVAGVALCDIRRV